jgi:hypothetical protein
LLFRWFGLVATCRGFDSGSTLLSACETVTLLVYVPFACVRIMFHQVRERTGHMQTYIQTSLNIISKVPMSYHYHHATLKVASIIYVLRISTNKQTNQPYPFVLPVCHCFHVCVEKVLGSVLYQNLCMLVHSDNDSNININLVISFYIFCCTVVMTDPSAAHQGAVLLLLVH